MIFTNLIFLSALFSFITSQTIKVVILLIKKEKHAFEALYREYGGMPSTHTTVVTAIVFSVYLLEGFSNLFFVSLIFSIIIVADVIDSKWFYSKRDKILNELIKKHNLSKEEKIKALEGEFGHTLLEVFVGILVALIVSWIIYLI